MRKYLSKIIVGVAIATLLLSQSNIKTKALDCKDINLVFARGSSQNLSGSETPFDSNIEWDKDPNGNIKFTRNDLFVSTEPESAKFFSGIGNRVIKDFPGLSMQFVSLHDFAGKYNPNGYKAVPAFGSWKTAYLSGNAVDARFGYSQFIAEGASGDYRQSVEDGAQELAGYLQDQMTICPSQLIVVGGFSQGAQVVGTAMQKMHDKGLDQLLSQLGHVDMFGDPKFNGFDLVTNRLNPLQKHITFPWVRGSPTLNHVGALGPRKPYVPDILTSKTTSWCDFNDLVCGGYAGLSIKDLQAHGVVYNEDGGWIEKSDGETYVDIKPRLKLLSGLTDKSANSPIAYWPGIAKPRQLSLMFVMDSTSDESLNLVPDDVYIATNTARLAKVLEPDGSVSQTYYSGIGAGVVTYTELMSNEGLEIPYVKTVVNLTGDLYGNYSYFAQAWGAEHFTGNNVAGAYKQDTPYSAIDKALDQNWNPDARKVIMIFSNSWGLETEQTSGITMKQIMAKAKAKKVEILPVFTSKTMRESQTQVNNVPAANAFWNKLAKGTKGHYGEVTDKLPPLYIYDMILGHVYAPDVVLSLGQNYTDPKTKKPAASTVSDKVVAKKGTKVKISAAKSSSPTSKVKSYKWDTNSDGIIDQDSADPIAEVPAGSTACVEVVAEDNTSTTDCISVEGSDDPTQITVDEPVILPTPNITAIRNGADLVLNWQPVNGDIVFNDPLTGEIMAIANGQSGTFKFSNVPTTEFDIDASLHNNNDYSDTLHIHVLAAPSSATNSDNSTSNQSSNGSSGGSSDQGKSAPSSGAGNSNLTVAAGSNNNPSSLASSTNVKTTNVGSVLGASTQPNLQNNQTDATNVVLATSQSTSIPLTTNQTDNGGVEATNHGINWANIWHKLKIGVAKIVSKSKAAFRLIAASFGLALDSPWLAWLALALLLLLLLIDLEHNRTRRQKYRS